MQRGFQATKLINVTIGPGEVERSCLKSNLSRYTLGSESDQENYSYPGCKGYNTSLQIRPDDVFVRLT